MSSEAHARDVKESGEVTVNVILQHIVQHDQFGGVSVGLGRHIHGGTDLYRIDDGTLIAIRYRDEILRPILRVLNGAVGLGFLLLHYNGHRQFLEN